MENTGFYLGNAISLQMLPNYGVAWTFDVVPTTPEEVAKVDFVSAVGHPDTARVISNILGKDVACQRLTIKLNEGDILYVAQLTGGRLPEGCTTLPDNFSLDWFKVRIIKK